MVTDLEPTDSPRAAAAETPPTSAALYVHVPFCTRKCPYCAFACTDDYDQPDVERFQNNLPRELERRSAGRSLRLDTLYFGGGTPSALGARGLDRLIGSLQALADFSALREFTVELNPAHVDDPTAEVLVRRGVDRVSLGAQSFNPSHLKRLGRDHRPEDVVLATDVLRRTGIELINIDLMYGLPLQTQSEFLEDVRRALDLGCTHFSLYALEFEPTTPFGFGRARGVLKPVDDGTAAEMFHAARSLLAANGMSWYEVSNFAVPGQESLHNRVYWRNGPYYGIGPGAYGRTGRTRYCNKPDVKSWSEAVEAGEAPTASVDDLGPAEDAIENLVAGLRTRIGVPWEALQFSPALRTAAVALIDEGFAKETAGGFALTLRGLLVLDALLPKFLSAATTTS